MPRDPHMTLDTPGPKSKDLFAREQEVMAPGLQSIALFSEIVMDRGEGCVLYDVDGNQYLDFIAGIAVGSVGHAHPHYTKRIKEQLDRIGVVHLKDVDAGAMTRERSGELDLFGAVLAGLFPSLGDGMVPLAEVIEVLESAGYDGWYVMETDVALPDVEPPIGEGPALGVARSLDFLRSLEVTR